MFAEYGKHIDKTIANIQSSLERKDMAFISREGHGLKGSGRMYGVEEISEIGFVIETAAKNGDEQNVSDNLLRLRKVYRRFWE
ncbi:MAG: Hpt domain-containing protein [Mesotoga sp.]|nr:Hpt domain-containing protein [Mesotoga sp.]